MEGSWPASLGKYYQLGFLSCQDWGANPGSFGFYSFFHPNAELQRLMGPYHLVKSYQVPNAETVNKKIEIFTKITRQ
jgi:hypothetical protein